ncbi:hypothetical protein GFL43_33535 [Rhizobium laguerreae]|nr:hypothetical protein [Rhizobium laguerreae]
MSIRPIILALALSISSSAFAQTAPENQVVGTWRMMSATIDPGGKNISAYGEKPNGVIALAGTIRWLK